MPRRRETPPPPTETPEQIRALAELARRASDQVGQLANAAADISDGLLATGWTDPISTLRGRSDALAAWADRLDAVADQILR